ncbi:MAG: hypothetical protein U9Q34_08135 [Elusimicrobiota bacterium]|nr:hypothetical protein [Elusimicrobiota bacterium]
MTWKEINTKYENSKKRTLISKEMPKRGKDWNKLLKSTDKLVWLFMMSGNTGKSSG